MSTYSSIILAKRPAGNIVAGETFVVKQNPALKESDLKDGEVLVEVLYLSLDPAMRPWLDDKPSYLPPVQIGAVMRGQTIARILSSRSPGLQKGDYVTCNPGWTEQAILPAQGVAALEVQPGKGEGGGGVRVTDALGVLGITGLTAYFGMEDVGRVKEGDFVVVSGAAGATGSVAVQIAKLRGARVLGIAGSDQKVSWLKEIGCDDTLNYKDPSFTENFNQATKDGIDVFYDNVGGEIFDLALENAKIHARFVICGAISQYNSTEGFYRPKNMVQVIKKRIKIQGFVVLDYVPQFGAAKQQLAAWLKEGKIQRKETVVQGGIGKAEEALKGLFEGRNVGKMLVEVKSPN